MVHLAGGPLLRLTNFLPTNHEENIAWTRSSSGIKTSPTTVFPVGLCLPSDTTTAHPYAAGRKRFNVLISRSSLFMDPDVTPVLKDIHIHVQARIHFEKMLSY